MDIQEAQAAFERGNLQKTDLVCRAMLAKQPDHAEARALLQRLIAHLGLDQPVHSRPDAHRYLLIKAWGFGFWSDMDHVLGALLVAELTGRIPLVQWGHNSLFRNQETDNAFETFFEPVSFAQWSHITAPGLTYFPPKWHVGNLGENNLDKWEGPGSRLTGLYFLNRPEQVLVSDFHVKVVDLMPWIPEGHPLHGLDRSALYRRLFRRHIRLKPSLRQHVDALWQAHFASDNWLAVHVRGTDKVHEFASLDVLNAQYHTSIQRILDVNPTLRIFLLTDSTEVVDDFQRRWGARLLSLPCQRGSGIQGVHLSGHPGEELGRQVITDAWLAARCDYFLGNGASNVSTGIRHIKDWPQGTYFLLGADFLGQTDHSLHNW